MKTQFSGETAAEPSGLRVYATNGSRGNIAVSDPNSNTIVADVALPGGSIFSGLAVSRDSTRVYAANGVGDKVAVIETAGNTVVATVPAERSFAVAVRP